MFRKWFTRREILAAGVGLATVGTASVGLRGAEGETADFSADFFRLCDLAARELNSPARKVPFYNDSYAVRALGVAYDLKHDARHLDACKAWAERMIGFQQEMIPAGAYYMNYGRKPGQGEGSWYVADSSSIALGVLATSVRCSDRTEKDRYLSSARSFASLVIENFIGPDGGICNGHWPKFAGQWWCSSGIFGSLMFLLHRETGEARYLEVGLGTIDWLNRLDFETAGPMTFAEMGATMPMYVLEAYSAAWPYLQPGTERYKAAVAQMDRALTWMAEHQVGRGSTIALDYGSQWGSKMGGLPFHMLVYARQVPGREDLLAAADQELRHIVHTIEAQAQPGLPQLVVFTLMSLAERVSPGAIYRGSR